MKVPLDFSGNAMCPKLQVYPNPFNDRISIRSEAICEDIVELKVYDIL